MFQTLIGIDEVGRGPIAGPVAVGAFVFLKPSARDLFDGIKESKQLTEKKREEWFVKICEAQREGMVDFSISFQSEKVIDKKGISFAIKESVKMCLEKLKMKLNIKSNEIQILLDGGLKAPEEYEYQKTIIKGDEKEMLIALASVVAKVSRDKEMKILGKKYPQYGFEKNKGYGTSDHYTSISKYGVSTPHRMSFLRKIKV